MGLMMNILFDATIIANSFNKNALRSGIYFTAQNILDSLLIRPDVNVLFYFSSENIESSICVHEELYPNVPCVQNFRKYRRLIILKRKIVSVHQNLSRKNVFRNFFSLGIWTLNFFFKNFFESNFDSDTTKNVDFFFSPMGKIPDVIRKNKNIRPCMFLHDAIPILYPNLNGSSFVKESCDSALDSDIIFYNSKSTRCDFERLYPQLRKNKSSVIYLAASKAFKKELDKACFLQIKEKYGIPVDKKYVFSLCTLEPRKNLIRSIRNFISFIEKNDIQNLIWVMGGGNWNSFVQQLKKNGLWEKSECVVRAGYIDDNDLPILYSNAEWFVYTSQYEGFGLPPLEAMQCGCPVITSNNSSLPEVVGDAGILIDWDSDEQHIEAYEKYYFNEKLRKENSRKGLEQSKHFSWEKTVDEMIRVLEKAN